VTRPNISGAAPIGAPPVVPLAIPPGAIMLAAPPALVSERNPEHLGMDAGLMRRTLSDMLGTPGFAVCVLVLAKRPRVLAAAPEDVVRFLRARRTGALVEAAPAAPAAPANDTPEELGDDVLRELGLPAPRPTKTQKAVQR
jgi:hypothetical protein